MKNTGDLTAIDYALLVHCGAQRDSGVSAYELASLAQDRVGGVLGFSPSHIYKELKLLGVSGHLMVVRTSGAKRDAPRYVLTELGLKAVREWVASAGVMPPLDGGEVFVRLRAMYLVRVPVVMRGMGPIQRALEAALDDLRREWRRERPTDTIARLEFKLFERLIGAYLDWFEELENELGEISDGVHRVRAKGRPHVSREAD